MFIMENENRIPKPPQKVEIPKKIGVVHTYAEDMASAVENIHGGEIKKLIERDEKFHDEEENVSPESKKNKFLMILSGILVLAAIIIIYLVIQLNKKTNTVIPTPIQQSQSIIFIDKSQSISIDKLTKEEIITTIKKEVSTTDVKGGGIEAIYLTENNKTIGFNRFIELLGINVPAEVSGYTDDNFLIGVHNGSIKSFFMLLKVRSFIDIFPGFKIWENKMFIDLHSLFGSEINADTKDLLTKDFADSIVGNKNARTLYDKNNKAVLEYVYANETSVVVISNDETATEIMNRLSAGTVKK